MKTAKHLLATTEFRSMKTMEEKAIALRDAGVSFRVCAEVGEMSLGQFQRAYRTSQTQGKTHCSGRPSYLTPEEEQQLVDMIKEFHEKTGGDPVLKTVLFWVIFLHTQIDLIE